MFEQLLHILYRHTKYIFAIHSDENHRFGLGSCVLKERKNFLKRPVHAYGNWLFVTKHQ
jgi:hypothetical protein